MDDNITLTTAYPIGNGGTITTTVAGSTNYGTSNHGFNMSNIEDLLDRYIFNRITVEHRVAEFELAKLKQTVPTYADEIKENLTKNAAREMVKKMTFTKKHDLDADAHHFIGRVWVFTEDELKKILEEAKHA